MAAADAIAPDARRYLESAPHLKHPPLTALYRRLAVEAMRLTAPEGTTPRVLDLGAGEGSATLAFLEAGARVVAVDEDGARLELLRRRAAAYAEQLEAREGDAVTAPEAEPAAYDVVSAVSFLHHVRDYESLVAASLRSLRAGGVFFSFQDPMLYASLGTGTRTFARVAYLLWRLRTGDLAGGARRYARRRLSGFRDDLAADAEEYHAQRGGVDHVALARLLSARQVPVRLILYFSTQDATFQRVGSALGLTNTFALIAGPVD